MYVPRLLTPLVAYQPRLYADNDILIITISHQIIFMKKNIYIALLVIDIVLMGYTGYYIATTKPATSPSIITTATTTLATSTSTEVTSPPNVRTFSLKSGGKIIVSETNPLGESLSSILITTEGFASTTPIQLEKNKLTDFSISDINGDGSEEFIMITTSQGSGSYGEAIIFTTANQKLTAIAIPEISEADTEKGGLFEGYMGHDIFNTVNGLLAREFPIYSATSTNASSTGQVQRILYNITEHEGDYTVVYSKATSSTPRFTPPSFATVRPLVSVTSPLAGTSWVWVSYTDTSKAVHTIENNKFTLTFFTNMAVTSYTDCNNTITTKATTTKDSLTFEKLLMTDNFCKESKESVYTDMLSKVKNYAINDTELVLTLPNKNTLIFKKK